MEMYFCCFTGFSVTIFFFLFSSVNWSDQDTSRQSSTQNNHRRLRRARRLRRVYEALTESESDDDGEPEVQNETAEGQDVSFFSNENNC